MNNTFNSMAAGISGPNRPSRAQVIAEVDGASAEVSAARGETRDPALQSKLDAMGGHLGNLRGALGTASESNQTPTLMAMSAAKATGNEINEYCA